MEQTFSYFPSHPPPVPVELHTGPEHPCAYLPDRPCLSQAFFVQQMPGEIYHRFMDAGFRRSGRTVYQPICRACRACIPIRVPVDRFEPGKSQRRWWRHNADLAVAVAAPEPTEEKFSLYQRYRAGWHGARDPHDWYDFVTFLYDSPVETVEITYRDPGGELIGVGICDVCALSLSSVYFYFDPGHASRRLGTFSVLWELELARRVKIPWYYLGYWVEGCRTMQYKSSFRPCELLGTDGVWRPLAEDGPP